MTTPLQQAAQAAIDRWDSPGWKDQPHTSVYIAELRKALADEQAQAVGPTLTEALAARGVKLRTVFEPKPRDTDPPVGERAELVAQLRANGDRLSIDLADTLEADAQPKQVTCQIYGHVVGACVECNTHIEALQVAVPVPMTFDEVESAYHNTTSRLTFARAIEARAQQVAVPAPVARVDSWTNGSYSRNYKITWLENVPAGTLLYSAAQGAKPNAPE